MAWSEQAASYLRGSTSCPRCERSPIGPESCPFCGAILTGPVAEELAAVSTEAAALLDRRTEVIGRLGTKAEFAPAPTGAPSAASTPPATVVTAPGAAAVTPGAPRASSQVSLGSVVAIAGAVLLAIAVLIFRFSDSGTPLGIRQGVIAGVTVGFLVLAWLLARVRLRVSAEAVGAVAMVFVALDVWALAESAPGDVDPWAIAAVSTLVASLLTLVIAVLVRLRVWQWLGLLGLVFVPAFFGYAVDGPWSHVVGHLGAAAAGLLGFEVARRMSSRFESPLRADRVTMVLATAFFAGVAVLSLPFVPGDDATERVVGSALVLAAAASLAVFATRTLAPRVWSVAAGVAAVAAVGILPLAWEVDDEAWRVLQVPLAAAVALAVVAHVPWPAWVRRAPLRIGGLAVALTAAVPAGFVALAQLLSPLANGTRAFSGETLSLAAILGLAVAAVGTGALWVAARRAGEAGRGWLVLTSAIGAAAMLAAPGWAMLSRPWQVAVGIALVLATALGLLLVPRLRALAVAVRLPFLLAAHGILAYLVAISWSPAELVVPAGVAIVGGVAVLALAVPAVLRPGYVAVGYGYALLLVARGLDLLGLELIPVISYTTTVACLFALAVTLVRRVRAPLWYAVLTVTAVPFVVGVVTVVIERTWETALANAAMFALALTLTLTLRPGLTRVVRSGAAALLLPSLSVVVVNVVPRIIETNVVPAWNGQGGAPVTLPVIATLVALVLPTTPLVAGWLRRGEIPEADAASARWWIELSAFVTGGIAALLSLVLETPDLGTALVVFVILGIGAASASVFAKRRYGWWVAAGSWTAALWCVWGLAGVTDIEPYVYPPALAAVVIGVVLVVRGRAGAALVAPGLAIAVATSLVVLAVTGSGAEAVLPWRALALLAASLVLLLLGSALGRPAPVGGEEGRVARLAALRVPLLATSIGAASAGAIQAVRYAWERDDLGLGHPDLVVWPVLAFSATAAVLAASAARALRPTHRWLQLPALAYLVVGPIAAVAPGVAPMWTLWALTLVLLGIMLVTVVAALRGPTILPPTWIVFVAAWCTAVAGWSVRDLNVEWFSLLLGLALTAAGVLALRRGGGEVRGTLASWPAGFSRSWIVLAPGIVVTVLPSVLATGTNPATWRALLVISLALVALLVGAIGRLAAPFVLSLVTFGVEFAFVLVQLLFAGRDIDPVVIWIASLTAGAILIFVAIWFERRSRAGAEGARMRDLR